MRFAGVVLTLLALAACGRPESPQPGVPTTAPATSTTALTTTTTTPTTTTAASTTARPELTLRGTVHAGVEAGCLLLSANGQEYLLLGGDRQVLTAGAEVIVEGRPDPGAVTTCQQGVPFHVSTATAAR